MICIYICALQVLNITFGTIILNIKRNILYVTFIRYGAVCSEYVALCKNIINTFVTSKLPGSKLPGYYFVTDSL